MTLPIISEVGKLEPVVVDLALRRRYPVSCALQVGDGVLPRLRPHAFFCAVPSPPA